MKGKQKDELASSVQSQARRKSYGSADGAFSFSANRRLPTTEKLFKNFVQQGRSE